MMAEWRWEKANASTAVARDVAALAILQVIGARGNAPADVEIFFHTFNKTIHATKRQVDERPDQRLAFAFLSARYFSEATNPVLWRPAESK